MSIYIPSLLAVDDEAPVRDFLYEALLPMCGHLCVVGSARQALRCMETHGHDVLLVDICLPGTNGIDLLKIADQLRWDCAVVLMTGHATLDQVARGLRLRAADLLVKPFTLESLSQSLSDAHERLRSKRDSRQEREQLRRGLNQSSLELEMARRHVDQSHRSALLGLISSLEAREYATYSHSFRVRAYAVHLAGLIGYPSEAVPQLALAALLHDIGKIAASDAVLLKPGPLTQQEFGCLKEHAAIGARIVSRMGFMKEESCIILHHHENWDGGGYPAGLRGEQIPLGSRLFAVADALDAMTSDRCYRKALSLTKARNEIARCAGTQFDPQIASAFNRVNDDVWLKLRQRADASAAAARIPEFSMDAVAFDSQVLLAQSEATL